jgi:hypothetical protein
LSLFRQRKHTLEISELTQPIEIPTMQEDDGRALTLVIVGDSDSIKGCESVHSAPLKPMKPARRILQIPTLRLLLRDSRIIADNLAPSVSGTGDP